MQTTLRSLSINAAHANVGLEREMQSLYDSPQSIHPLTPRSPTFAPRRLIVLEQHSLLFDCFCFAEQQVFVLW